MRAFIFSTVLGLSILTQAAAVTKDARCAVNGNGANCLNGRWGDCCSEQGWCGSTNAYCGSGCQPEFGTCNNVYSLPIENPASSIEHSSTSSSFAAYNKPTSSIEHSSTSSSFAVYNKPTSSIEHSSISSSFVEYSKPTPTCLSSTELYSESPSSTQAISANTRCGKNYSGQTCKGSQWGNCCSNYDYCGRTDLYCRPDLCQQGYGECDPISSLDVASSHAVTTPTSSPSSDTAW